MEKQQAEGIILQTVPFKDYDSILTLFTPNEGLLKLFVKGAFRQKNGVGNRTIPLSLVEIGYSYGRSDLAVCHEIEVIEHHLALRKNYDLLNAGCDMIKAVLETQQQGKAAVNLYKLLCLYLKKLPEVISPAILSTSFLLKVLRHEGLFAFAEHCSVCQCSTQDKQVFAGDTYCSRHAPLMALSLCNEELQLFNFLAFCRDLTQFHELSLPPSLFIKAQDFFKHSLEHSL